MQPDSRQWLMNKLEGAPLEGPPQHVVMQYVWWLHTRLSHRQGNVAGVGQSSGQGASIEAHER